jgi:hypothetical protein
MSYDVIFRINKKNNEVIALLPEIPMDIRGELCKGYSSLHKFVSVYCSSAMKNTRLAKPEEYHDVEKDLLAEGYCLNLVQRYSKKYDQIRRDRVKSAICQIE